MLHLHLDEEVCVYLQFERTNFFHFIFRLMFLKTDLNSYKLTSSNLFENWFSFYMNFRLFCSTQFHQANLKGIYYIHTSNIGSPVTLDRAPNSMIIVPAQAVQVSDSLPVPDDGWWMPYLRFTCRFVTRNQQTCMLQNIWMIINSIALILHKNMLVYLSLDIICSSKLTVFLELCSWKIFLI